MNNRCEKLPLPLETENKEIQEIIDSATNILIKDFSMGLVKFRGREIKAKYPYTDKFSYEHILKLDENNISNDIKILRCMHAPKFRILLEEQENRSCPHFKHWKEFDTKRSQWRHIILCEKEKLLIVLGEFKNFFVLITAYYINYPNYLKGQLKRYNESNNKLK